MHIPVLQKEVLEHLDPKPNENFIDCTVGEAGHALAILEKNGPKGRVLGIDADPEILKNTKYRIQDTKYKNRVILVCDNFVNLKEIVQKYKFKPIHGILFDLGMSSWHLEESGRGFSFQRREPLDMRYNPRNQLTAERIVNYWSRFELEKILKEYGEERFAKSITEKIIEERRIGPIETTLRLVEIIKKAVPKRYLFQRIHFATRTFQALRIAVNDELNNLKKTLPQALGILKPGGRLVVISFHSLEDRIVKNFLSASARGYGGQESWAKEGLPAPYSNEVCSSGPKIRILTKKPVTPSRAEIKINPRARSAKLRAIVKL